MAQYTTQEMALSLFERPTEPVFMPKGDKGIYFDIPSSYIIEKYQPLANELKVRFNQVGQITPVKINPITMPASMNSAMQLPRRASFSLFIPFHRELAGDLVSTLMGMRTQEDFFSACAFCRDRVNPNLFIYAYSVALLHRPDTRNLRIPPLSEIFPDKFIDGAIFAAAREETTLIVEETQRPALEIPRDYTASDLEIEHRVAYFREDIGINLHHWHWHLIYPLTGPMEVVNKDRRGELFYFMHQQIVARYDFERLSNKLGRVKRLMNLNDPIEEAYFPKLDSLIASRSWLPRVSGAVLKDIDREVDQLKVDIQDLERWRSRIFDAIHRGRVEMTDGTMRPLTIDMLGNMLESTPVLSPNYRLYGDLHNLGHVAISLCHDPDQRHLETFGVMGDSATAMRDPVFYRWHAFVNDIFVEFKNTQPRYTVADLGYEGIKVTSIEIVTPNSPPQTIETFWQQSELDLSRGLDFNPRGSILARVTHLQHMPFQYRINVENTGNAPRMGTVRIFLAPKFDERNQPWQFIDQRNLFIELDRFTVNLRNDPRVTTINRSSRESTVTIPFDQTFRNLEMNRPAAEGSALNQFNFCGCGWPQHMLVPKGEAGGMPCELFVMISNYENDRVTQQGNQPNAGSCADSAPYCGIRDQLYPDRRSMGYPFDRLPRTGANTLRLFMTPNMGVADVTIRFTDRVQPPQTQPNQSQPAPPQQPPQRQPPAQPAPQQGRRTNPLPSPVVPPAQGGRRG